MEERLSALVSLVGVANEGNSIRVILEVSFIILLFMNQLWSKVFAI